MTVCLDLTRGRPAFTHGRPKTPQNKAMNAGGLNGMTGYGMSAHLDQILDGRPLGC